MIGFGPWLVCGMQQISIAKLDDGNPLLGAQHSANGVGHYLVPIDLGPKV